MLPVLVVFGFVTLSEAGFTDQHKADVGLNHHQHGNHAGRPALARSYNAHLGLRSAPSLPSAPLNHGIAPPRVSRVALPPMYPLFRINSNTANTRESLHFRSVPRATSLSNNYILPVNTPPIRFAAIEQGSSNVYISPATSIINHHASLRPDYKTSSYSAVPITSSYKTVNVLPEKSLSYAISHQDYEYLKRHKVEGQDSPYNPLSGFNTSPDSDHIQNPHSYHTDNAPLHKRSKFDNVLKRSAALNMGFQVTSKTSNIQGNHGERFIQGNDAVNFFQNNNEPIHVPIQLIHGNSHTSFLQRNNEPCQIQKYSETNYIQGYNDPYLIRGNNEHNLIQENHQTSYIQRTNEPNHIQENSETSFIQDNNRENIAHNLLQENSDSSLIQGNGEPNLLQENSETSLIQGINNHNLLQENTETTFIQRNNEHNQIQENSVTSFIQGHEDSTQIQGNSLPSLTNVPEPVVSKHIYFHVPPPDFEEHPRVQIISEPTPKKSYNIVFIKAPYHEQQNNIYLQQLRSSQSQIEDKTLIYVLSKKQDPHQVELPVQQAPLVSNPEVYFIKYKNNAGHITDTSNKHGEDNLVENVSPEAHVYV